MLSYAFQTEQSNSKFSKVSTSLVVKGKGAGPPTQNGLVRVSSRLRGERLPTTRARPRSGIQREPTDTLGAPHWSRGQSFFFFFSFFLVLVGSS